MNKSISFLFTFISGFSTLLGTIPIFFNVKKIDKFICIVLSFSSGIMFSISIFDLLFESLNFLNKEYSIILSIIIFICVFLSGFLLSSFINKKIDNNNSLYKVGIVTVIGIILHNIPEGILTYMATNLNTNLGSSITLAIMMHNIPEGLSISVPIYYSTNSRKKAILIVFLSALSEPFGALISFLFLNQFVNQLFIGIIISLVCGIMIYISIFELYKESKKYNKPLLIKLFFSLGFLIMFLMLKI